ncbi:homoserine kinase [Thraustotheca clavata]|uniref:Homoserine kinase n=1 Tax=Thraustotheca clavata TaxID=74557 RepID=A0A1V9YM02_9STRA|nr:homoserine kinase [Thraustotheca clavata]
MLSDVATKLSIAALCTALVYYVGSKKERVKKQQPVERPPRKVSQGSSGFGPKNSVTVRVPATTANMGPGFDSIGMALDIWNELTVQRSSEFSFTNEGEGSDVLPTDDTNLVVVGLKAAFDAAGQTMPPLHIHCRNRIPFARGLGSSSAGIVAGIIAGLVIAGHELSVHGKEELLQIAAGIEGHPDNVAPCIYGGLQLGIHTDDRWYSSRVQIPDGMQCVLFIPETTGKTSTARAILPAKVDRSEAVFNIGRAAILVNAFRSGNLAELRHAVQDKLHQPQRGQEQYRHLYPLIQAAQEAGAHGCFLSGAGPTVLAITSGLAGDIFTQVANERAETKVADAMRDAAAKVGVKGCVFITNPEHRGAHIVKVDPKISDHLVARYEGDITDL